MASNAAGFVQCTNDSLWPTEDATHMARARRLDTAGALQIILTHLRSKKTILPLAVGRQLASGSTGGQRIVKIDRPPPHSETLKL